MPKEKFIGEVETRRFAGCESFPFCRPFPVQTDRANSAAFQART